MFNLADTVQESAGVTVRGPRFEVPRADRRRAQRCVRIEDRRDLSLFQGLNTALVIGQRGRERPVRGIAWNGMRQD